MAIGQGTNFFDGASTVQVALTDASGNAVLARGTVANLPSAVSGYAVSCIYQATDSGAIYENTGTASSCTFTLMDTASTSLQLPEAATDASTTSTTSLDLTFSALTSGIGQKLTANALTSGQVLSINSSATAITSTGRLLDVTHSGATTTSGILVEFETAATDETIVLQLKATGDISTGRLLKIVGDAITTGTGIRADAGDWTSLTDGKIIYIASDAVGITGGSLFVSDHTGNASVSGVLNQFNSAAADETIILQAKASAALALGKVMNISGVSVTTGTLLDISDNTAHTTGTAVNIVTNSSSASTRTLVNIKQDHASATGTTVLALTQDAPTSTNYFKVMTLNGVTLWIGNGTTPNGNLTGTLGDVLFNGSGTGQSFYCTGTTNWTAFA